MTERMSMDDLRARLKASQSGTPAGGPVLVGDMQSREVGRCYRCDRSVLWTVTEHLRRMPVDPPALVDASSARTVVFRDAGDTLRSRRLEDGAVPLEGESLAMPHQATCPDRGKSMRQARRDAGAAA